MSMNQHGHPKSKTTGDWFAMHIITNKCTLFLLIVSHVKFVKIVKLLSTDYKMVSG